MSKKSYSCNISGMDCASCAVTIKKGLKNLKGVISVQVNYANEVAHIEYNDSIIKKEELINFIESLGYKVYEPDSMHMQMDDLERKKELYKMKIKLLVSSVVTAILMFGAMVPFAPVILKSKIIMWVLATPIQFWVGWKFYVLAFKALKKGRTNMYTLIALGTSVAYFYSVFVVLFENWFITAGIPPHVYFESAVAIITFILLGRFLEIRAKGRASSAIKELMNLQPQKARVSKTENNEKKWVEIPVKDVVVGDIILIKPGEKIPVDGVIVEGGSTIDESMVTGESMHVYKKEGGQVIGATINTTGSFQMKATKVGGATMLSRIIELVRKAQGSKAPIQNVVDIVSAYFVPAVIVAAFLSGIFWWIFGPEPTLLYAIVSVVSVLIIACPCALGLATPTSVVVGVGRGAKEGILIKDAKIFELAKKINVVVFDKTGTLTLGKQDVRDFRFAENIADIFEKISLKTPVGVDPEKYVSDLILSVERLSGHPVSEAVVRYLENGNTAFKVKGFEAISGLGVKAFVNDHEILIGSKKLMETNNVEMTSEAHSCDLQWVEKARTVSFVSLDKNLISFFCLADTIRPEVKSTIAKLSKMSIESVMITGDNEVSAAAVAKEVGIKRFFAKVLPEEKASYVKKLKSEGNFVAMVGDGINDAPALASADVGIAIGSGTDIAIESAQAALLRSDISLVPKIIKLSQATMKNIWQNLFWAFGYNLVLVPVAMGCLYPLFGVTLSPMLAGAAMSFSSVSVVVNALRLKRISLD